MSRPTKKSPRRVVRAKKAKNAPRTKAISPKPSIKTLTRSECLKMLAKNKVGRIAFAFHDRVEILPIHYVYEDGWLYGRTSLGAKLIKLRHNHWVAFEVDEVKGIFDWSSVIVHGTFHPLTPGGFSYEEDVRAQALKLTRKLVPEAMTDDDPVPHRIVLFRIYVDEVSGRVAKQQRK